MGYTEFNAVEQLGREVSKLNNYYDTKIRKLERYIGEEKEDKLRVQRPGYNGSGEYSSKSDETKAIEHFFRAGGDITALPDHERNLIDFNRMDYSRFPDEQKVLVSSAADLGGFFAGTDLSSKFIQKLFLISHIRQYADVQVIGGEKLIIPSEGATDTNIFWSDEQTGFVASPDPNLGMIEIFARELNGYLKLSRQNLEDSVFDIEAFILKRLTRQFAQKEGAAFINGNGVARPEGILTAVASGFIPAGQVYTTNDATNHTVVPQDLVNCMHKVKSQYRPKGVWLMSNATIGALRLFEDSTARPIWNVFGDSFVETLYGRPIVEIPDLPDPTGTFTSGASHPGNQAKFTAAQTPIIFADLADGYQIVDRIGLTFTVLKELYAIQNQVAYLARQRVGGKVVLPEAFAILKIA